MKYMLLIYMSEGAMTDSERATCYAESARLVNELHADGRLIAASPLHPVSTATSVRVRDGRRLVTDGPFAETREQLGGFYLLDVETEAEALAIAARVPPATKGTVEVRPIMELPGLPPSRLVDAVSART